MQIWCPSWNQPYIPVTFALTSDPQTKIACNLHFKQFCLFPHFFLFLTCKLFWGECYRQGVLDHGRGCGIGIAIESIELQVLDSQKIHDHSHGEFKCLMEHKKRWTRLRKNNTGNGSFSRNYNIQCSNSAMNYAPPQKKALCSCTDNNMSWRFERIRSDVSSNKAWMSRDGG